MSCAIDGFAPSTDSGGFRICKRGAKVERRRQEYRGAEGAKGGVMWEGGFPLPTGGEVSAPSPENFLTLDRKMSTSSAF